MQIGFASKTRKLHIFKISRLNKHIKRQKICLFKNKQKQTSPIQYKCISNKKLWDTRVLNQKYENMFILCNKFFQGVAVALFGGSGMA